jgi:hypothetical protein
VLTETDVEMALAAARRAPAGLDGWRVRHVGTTFEVVADGSDHALLVRCGAALRHLFLALRAAGNAVTCELFPDPVQPDLVARLQVCGTRIPSLPESELFEALWSWRTASSPLADLPVPAPVVDHLRAVVRADGCALDVVGPPDAGPLVLVLGAPGDDPGDAVTQGWALSDLLLSLEHDGLAAAPLPDHPQTVLRVGVPGPVLAAAAPG